MMPDQEREEALGSAECAVECEKASLARADLAEALAQRYRDALEQALTHSLLEIRRAAFAPEIGVRYTDDIRRGIADECRRLEDFIRATIARSALEQEKA